ncbi:MAG: DNA-processing protein DprA [Mariprofundales bacterium]|nr:DNA-processing protein DprA [Mariprofundales bacterium]
MTTVTAAATACLRLQMVQGIGSIIGRRLIDAAGSAERLWHMGASRWQEIEGVGERLVTALQHAAQQDLTPTLAKCHAHEIFLLGIDDPLYPPLLASCDDAPLLLFGRGDPAALSQPRMLAVVGARRASREGVTITRRWTESWSQQQIAIVSGMAPGIDSGAHSGSLKGGCGGVAVLGYGLLTANEIQQRQIDAICAHGGAVISEFMPTTRAQAPFFPRRNRIIAGLTQATVVIEATLRSGSLITAHRALNYGRELFAVPGGVLVESHRGCHQLIQRGEALLTESPQQVMEQLGWQRTTATTTEEVAITDPVEQQIYQLLATEILHIDAIAEGSNLTVAHLAPALLALEMRGIIERLPGSRYTLTTPTRHN